MLHWSLTWKVSLAEEERRGEKGSPASLASCGRANSAPSNDSGHVSAEPYSLPSVSSTKVFDISSTSNRLGKSIHFQNAGNVHCLLPSIGPWPSWGPHCWRCHTSLHRVHQGKSHNYNGNLIDWSISLCTICSLPLWRWRKSSAENVGQGLAKEMTDPTFIIRYWIT